MLHMNHISISCNFASGTPSDEDEGMFLFLSEKLIPEKKRNPALAPCKLKKVVTKWKGQEGRKQDLTGFHRGTEHSGA